MNNPPPGSDAALSSPVLRQIVHDSAEYRAACELRNRVLRLPLGRDLYREDLAAEVSQLHFGLYDAQVLQACVSVLSVVPRSARIRQMAVRSERQGMGYGRRLMRAVEGHLLGAGVTRLELHARVTALGFYAGLGYSCVGGRYNEVGIPHQSMVKDMAAVNAGQ